MILLGLEHEQLLRALEKINSSLTFVQRNRNVKVTCGATIRDEVSGLLRGQAIDREGTATSGSSERRPWEAFSNWRTRTAGTGRLNK